MDHFLEEVVVRRNRAAQEMLFYLANITMIWRSTPSTARSTWAARMFA